MNTELKHSGLAINPALLRAIVVLTAGAIALAPMYAFGLMSTFPGAVTDGGSETYYFALPPTPQPLPAIEFRGTKLPVQTVALLCAAGLPTGLPCAFLRGMGHGAFSPSVSDSRIILLLEHQLRL